jgi:hypothetical protein
MDAELISLIEAQVERSDLTSEEKLEVKDALAVLPSHGLRVLYEAFEFGPLHVRTFFESYKRKKDILARKDMKAWRKLIDTELQQVKSLL